jgi:hypothetical protein
VTETEAIETAIEEYETRIHPDAQADCCAPDDNGPCHYLAQLVDQAGRRYCWDHAFERYGWRERDGLDVLAMPSTPSTGLSCYCALCGRFCVDRDDTREPVLPRQFSTGPSVGREGRWRFVCAGCYGVIERAYHALKDARRREPEAI